MRAFLLAALIALAAIAPADAARRAGRHFGQPPALVQGPGWGAAETPQPPTQGLPGAPGYGDNAIAVWDSVSYALYNTATPICVLAYHNSGIASVMIALDNGPWVTAIYTTTAGASPGVGEYCAILQPSAMLDGQHEIRAIITPNTGIPRVLQSGASVNVTSGNPYIPHAAHGQIYYSPAKSVVVTGGASAGFAANTAYYLARGGMDSHGYMLSDTQSAPTMTFNVSSLPWSITTAPVAPHAGGYTAGAAITIQHQGGNIAPTSGQMLSYYYVCASGLTSTNYQLSSTYADAMGSCAYANTNPFSAIGSASGTFYAQPVIVPSASGTIAIDYQNKGELEQGLSAGESLFINTNANATANFPALYVNTSGNDGNSCTSAAPCATISGAFANLRSGSFGSISSTTPAVSVNGSGCVVFIKSSHGYAKGKGLILSGTLGAAFQPVAGSIDLSQQVYYVGGNATTGATPDYSANTFTLSLQPGGACVPWTAGDTYSVTAQPDIGGSTIYLMCDAPCSTPSQYTLDYTTASRSVQTYVNILPAPGLTAANVAITVANWGAAKATDKIHVGVNLTSPTTSLPLTSVSSSGSQTFSFTTGTLPSWMSTSTYLTSDNGAACASIGSSGGQTTVTAFNNLTNPATVTVSVPNFADCPAGAMIKFTNAASLFYSGTNNSNAIWVDSQTSTGPGDTVPNWHIAGGQQANFYTNVVATGWDFPYYASVLVRNASVDGGAQAFDAPLALINVTSNNVARNEYALTTTCADGNPSSPASSCPAQVGAISKLYFQPGTLPANTQTGWLIGVGTQTTCGQATSIITAFHPGTAIDPPWISISPGAPSTCTVGASVIIGPGSHADFVFELGSGNNNVVVNSRCFACNAEGFFEQSGTYWDQAVVNTLFQATNTANTALELESPLTNAYFYGNTFNATIGMRSSFAGKDVVYINNTCGVYNGVDYSGQVTNQNINGVTVIGGNC